MGAPLHIPFVEHFTMLGIVPQMVEFAPQTHEKVFAFSAPVGSEHTLFIQTPAAHVAQTPQLILVQLGHLYDSSGQTLAPDDLFTRGLVTPDTVKHDELLGDGLIAVFNRTSARLLMYRALLAVPEVYYHATSSEIVCADNLKTLIGLLPDAALDEGIVPLHMMFRLVCGTKTYLQDVQRLRGGDSVSWQAGAVHVEQRKTLHPFKNETRFADIDNPALDFLDSQFDRVIAYFQQRASGSACASLLSGGVDSSLMQWFIQQRDGHFQSFSYDMQTPIFAPEKEYAAEAVNILKTQHTFIPLTPEAYADLTLETIVLLGQPAVAEPEPCFLGIARYLREQRPDIQHLFIGAGADALMGGSLAEIWWHLGYYQHTPAARSWLPIIELPMRKINPHHAFVLRRVIALLPTVGTPTSESYPGNEYEFYSDIALIRRCFGDQKTGAAFDFWQDTQTDYLESQSIVERAQLVSYLNTERIKASLTYQVFQAQQVDLMSVYHDEHLVRATFAVDPGVRFYHRGTIKPVLKCMVARKSAANPAKKTKLGSGFYDDLKIWMKQGCLRDRIHAMSRPGFISQPDFERKLAEPDWFTWNMYTLDLFQRHVLH